MSIRLFYTADSASRKHPTSASRVCLILGLPLFAVNFLNTILAGYPRSPVPCRALGSQDEGWDAALLIFAAFDDKEAS